MAALLVVALVLTPSGAFTASTVPRISSVDGVSDANGMVGFAVESGVNASSTERLVDVTNNRGSSVTVTVTLDPSATDVGILVVNGVDQGNSATFALASGATETVEISVLSDCSLGGRSVPFDVTASAPDFDFTAERASQVESTTLGQRNSVALHGPTNGHLEMLERDGTLTNFGFATSGFGPADADYDCDGKMEIPYVDSNSGISIVDVDGETQTLVSSGVRNGVTLGVGDFDGDGAPAILYPNANDNDHIYRVELNGDNVEVAGVSAASIAGVADFNGDGDVDVIYTDAGSNLRYYDDGVGTDTGVNPACATCIGAPADFDGDGAKRVPFRNSANDEIMLADGQGNTELVWSGSATSLGSLGSFDWNNDGTTDILAIADFDTRLYWLNYLDGNAYGPITDSSGSDVDGDSFGVA